MVAAYQRLVAAFGLLLGGATWRLWVPQHVYPQVPLLRWAIDVDPRVDWLLVAIALLALMGMLIFAKPGRWQRVSCWGLAISVSLSIVLDQHRCQPWAYQFILLSLVFGLSPGDHSVGLLRTLAVSIYVYSALGKLDYQFLHTVGQQLIGALVGLAGVDATTWPLGIRLVCAGSLPTIELAIAIGLIFEKTRHMTSYVAAIMHAVLILVLGPMGLKHAWGVLFWNAFFICQSILLFSGNGATLASSDESKGLALQAAFCGRLARLVIALAIALPIVERFGWFDHWPSWALYAPHSSRVNVEVAQAAVDRLPAELQTLLPASQVDDLWIPVPIAQWSLESLSAPIYPQARFQLGVAESLCDSVGEFEIRAVELSSSSRWTGARASRTHEGISAIRAASDRFRLNAHPRARFRDSPEALP